MRRGFRLGNGRVMDLIWLFGESQAIGGLAAQCYRTGSADTAPERLLLQERLVDQNRGSFELEARLLACARRMTRDPGEGCRAAFHWDVLRRSYGPPSRHDPFGSFEDDLAPLVRLTPTVRGKALEDWPEWHVRQRRALYEQAYSTAISQEGRHGAVARLLRLMPDDAPQHELDLLVDKVVEGLAVRRRQKASGRIIRDKDGSTSRAAEREADAMLAAASATFDRADRGLREDRKAEKAALKAAAAPPPPEPESSREARLFDPATWEKALAFLTRAGAPA